MILDKSANKEQLIDILNSMKFPIMGAGGGFAPIGAESYFDGTTAPEGWLLCDGSTHNIADYPELAAYYASQHGAANYYGGNGTTTFAVPVRNGMPNSGVNTPDEHIVGEWRQTVSGVKKRKPVYEKSLPFTGSGSNVNIASMPEIDVYIGTSGFISETGSVWDIVNTGCRIGVTNNAQRMVHWQGNQWGAFSAVAIIQYTKTTDKWQAVQEGHSSDGNGVFCVKATVAGDPNAHHYSTEEQVVEKWIDGSDVYEKTVTVSSLSNGGTIGNIGIGHKIKNGNGVVTHANGDQIPLTYSVTPNEHASFYYHTSTGDIVLNTSLGTVYDVSVTIRYTKTSA